MVAEEKLKETQDIREIVAIFKELDPESRLLVQSNARTLLARDQMTRERKKHSAAVEEGNHEKNEYTY